MKGFKVINPGMHSLLQDKGRTGYHSLGITSGGAFDQYSFGWQTDYAITSIMQAVSKY